MPALNAAHAFTLVVEVDEQAHLTRLLTIGPKVCFSKRRI